MKYRNKWKQRNRNGNGISIENGEEEISENKISNKQMKENNEIGISIGNQQNISGRNERNKAA